MHTLFMSHNVEAVYHFSNLFKLPADTYGMDICSAYMKTGLQLTLSLWLALSVI